MFVVVVVVVVAVVNVVGGHVTLVSSRVVWTKLSVPFIYQDSAFQVSAQGELIFATFSPTSTPSDKLQV